MVAVLGSRTNEAVRTIIERWVERLVERRFDEALALLAPSAQWEPELLATVIRNYGFVAARPDAATFEVTAAAVTVGDGPRFEVDWFAHPTPDGRLGHAHFGLPLNGQWSDVTAIFGVVETNEGVCLALEDVHVL